MCGSPPSTVTYKQKQKSRGWRGEGGGGGGEQQIEMGTIKQTNKQTWIDLLKEGNIVPTQPIR